jgi:Raf kinase inhibitor-like YbhB/YbcL family protein
MMNIVCPAFTDGQSIPAIYTCKSRNINPPLMFTGVSRKAKSLFFLLEDVDATPIPWVHWLVYNISPSSAGILEASVPAGSVEGLANGGTPGYEGPCPIYFSGIHHYLFRLYALDVQITPSRNLDKREILSLSDGHILETAVLVGTVMGEKADTI